MVFCKNNLQYFSLLPVAMNNLRVDLVNARNLLKTTKRFEKIFVCMIGNRIAILVTIRIAVLVTIRIAVLVTIIFRFCRIQCCKLFKLRYNDGRS